MALMPTRGQQIIVETSESLQADVDRLSSYNTGSALCSWVWTKVNIWEDVRNRGYQQLWGEYWRMWRGKWSVQEINRLSERSKLIAPALAQAIEQTVSEIEEAIFSKEEWFDVAVETAKDMAQLASRDQLLSDLDKVNAADQIMEAILNGAIFGTMVAKVNTGLHVEQRPKRDPVTYELKASTKKMVTVAIESIRPDELVPDPVGKSIDQMLGVAHRVQKPLHYIQERCAEGVYDQEAIKNIFPTRRLKNSDVDHEDPMSINTTYESEQIDLIEYHGKVPARFLMQIQEARSVADELLNLDLEDLSRISGDGPLIEAIVTIANQGVLLRAIPNPYTLGDRSIVAAQFEKVPGRFWGRGVAEKGYNPQKALDAELRSRMDALGYISAPMLGIDSGRIPRGFKLEVKPGKVWPTQGDPREVLNPFPALNMNTMTFEQTQEMERMVQMGTGALDVASAIKNQSQSGSNSMSSNSMLMGAFVKRSKRSIANISRNFIGVLLQKVIWRYMQFDPVRYPQDFNIKLKPTLGIVAREVEAGQMTQLMGMMPEEYHQVQLLLAQGVIEHTALSNKAVLLQAIDKVLNPDPKTVAQQQQMQQQMQMLQMQGLQEQVKNLQAETAKIQAEIQNIGAQAHERIVGLDLKKGEQLLDAQRVKQEAGEQQQFAVQNQIALARLPIERQKNQIDWISAQAKMIQAKAQAHAVGHSAVADHVKSMASMVSAKAQHHAAHNPPPRASASK
jgi:hypothetical protein